MAVATGRMQMRSEWETPRTKITHVLGGDNFKIRHLIGYESREFKLAAEQAKGDEKSLKERKGTQFGQGQDVLAMRLLR